MMSHASRIGALAEDLIQSINVSGSPGVARDSRRDKDNIIKSLRTQQYARTNQFEVETSLNGLVEKFQILNRDDLADALSVRLAELSKTSSKWTPEVLSLLLHLSDRPVEKSNVSDLELLKPPESPPPLTWADIIADDPFDEDSIWDVPKYDAESSEDEASWEKEIPSDQTKTSPPSSIDDVNADPRSFIELPDQKVLGGIEAAQFWRSRNGVTQKTNGVASSDRQDLTELQAVREVLFMLRNLPTTLFRLGDGARIIVSSDEHSLSNVSAEAFKHQLDGFAAIGSAVHGLRQWTRGKQSIPLLQTFQAAVIRRCQQFNRAVAALEKRFHTPTAATTASLLEIYAEAQLASAPLLHLVRLVDEVPPASHPFAYLEALYDHVCSTQMIGEVRSYEYLAKLFFECLQTYLNPIRKWMEHGELDSDDNSFFIVETGKSTEPSSLWHERYALRYAAGGTLHAPKFLHPAAQKILNTGKSVIFLQHVGRHDPHASVVVPEPHLDFDTVCQADDALLLVPFSEKFETAFDDWIRSKYHVASASLCQHLFSYCGLWKVLDALEYLYFSKDGSLFQTFTDTVFEKLDGHRRGWNDRFLLTELAQSTFGSLQCLDQDRLMVRTTAFKQPGRGVKLLSSISINYMLPWPVLNVVRKSSIATYQSIFTFLSQVYRGKYMLCHKGFQTGRASLGTGRDKDPSYLLRYRLIWFADVLHTYVTDYVLVPSTAQMRTRLADAEDIDAMAANHEEYITQLQARCLLAKNLAPIHEAIISVLDLCVLFCDSQTQRKLSANTAQRGPSYDTRRRGKTSRLRHLRSTEMSDSSGDEDDTEREYDADTEVGPVSEGPYEKRIGQMREEFDRLCAFISAGLRGVSRAGGEQCWEMLAERLEW